jgi:hypothetical protein
VNPYSASKAALTGSADVGLALAWIEAAVQPENCLGKIGGAAEGLASAAKEYDASSVKNANAAETLRNRMKEKLTTTV